jgi:hypothetical protein
MRLREKGLNGRAWAREKGPKTGVFWPKSNFGARPRARKVYLFGSKTRVFGRNFEFDGRAPP